MKRAAPSEEPLDVSSGDSDSLSSDSDEDAANIFGLPNTSNAAPAKQGKHYSGALIRRAEMYQQYMKLIPVPPYQGSVIPFTSWMGLGRSMKQLYKQPLHYLTNVLLKRWDQQRIGSDDGHRPLDAIIHPVRAETLIWATEEVHRLTTSGYHLARLWFTDPMYHAYIDPVFPSMKLE